MNESALKSSNPSGLKGPLSMLNLTMKSITTFKETSKWFLLYPSISGEEMYSQNTLQKIVTFSWFSRQYKPKRSSPLALSYFESYYLMIDINISRSQLYRNRLIHIKTFLVFSESCSISYWTYLSWARNLWRTFSFCPPFAYIFCIFPSIIYLSFSLVF